MNTLRLYRFFRDAGSPITIREAFRIRHFHSFMHFVESDSIESWKRKRKAMKRGRN